MSQSSPARRIALGADHGGFALKERIKRHLAEQGHAIEDCGAFDAQPVDYPRIAEAVARKVSSGHCPCGIIADGAGIGSAIAANKFPGVRAGLCYDLSTAKNSREHNDANVLTLGAGLIGEALALQIVDVWLTTPCTVERHRRRVAMISEIERSTMSATSTLRSDYDAPSTTASPAPNPTPPAASGGPDGISEDDLARIVERISLILAARSGGPCDPCAGLTGHAHNACVTNPDAVRGLIGAGADRVSHSLADGAVPSDLAKYIDHTLLRPDCTSDQIRTLCEEARQHGFASVCVNPTYVRLCRDLLRGTSVAVCTVIGFPFGTHVADIKKLETARAIRDGAKEIDMVINIGALKSGDDELVYRDIRAVVDACVDGSAICKVIIETAMLADEEKIRACHAARRARADYVKTSTGYGGGGATAADVALMKETVCGTRMGVKASGGIRSLADAKKMIEAGATRLGVSAGVKIMKEALELAV